MRAEEDDDASTNADDDAPRDELVARADALVAGDAVVARSEEQRRAAHAELLELDVGARRKVGIDHVLFVGVAHRDHARQLAVRERADRREPVDERLVLAHVVRPLARRVPGVRLFVLFVLRHPTSVPWGAVSSRNRSGGGGPTPAERTRERSRPRKA